MSKTPVQPWDRQPKETPPAWAAFVAYRDMGAGRSLAKAGQKIGKHVTVLEGWSSKHAWQIRVRAWDNEQDRLWQLELKTARRTSARRTLNTAEGAMKIAGQALAAIGTDQKKVAALKPGDIARLMEVAARMERLVLGEATEHVQVTDGRTGAAAVGHAAVLTDEERAARLAMLEREITSRRKAREEELGKGEEARAAAASDVDDDELLDERVTSE